MSHLDQTIKNYIDELNLTIDELYQIKDHAKQIYIELLKLEYPAATETHRESLAKQSFIMAFDHFKSINFIEKSKSQTFISKGTYTLHGSINGNFTGSIIDKNTIIPTN